MKKMLSLLLALLMLISLLPTSLAEAVETTSTMAEVSDEPIVNLPHDPNGIPTVFYQGNTIVGPGNAVGIRGEYLDQEWTATITDGEKSAEVELIQQNRQSFKFVIPADFQANTLYTLTLDGEKPLSIILNKPVVQWMQGDEGAISTVGGWVRVQGECLTLDETKPHTLTLTATDGTVTTLNADRVYDAYSVGFVIPELPLGEYKAVYANGFGEDDAGVLTIGVSHESQWSQKVYDVTKYKIDNTGATDSTAMLNVLLGHMANTGGGVLYFPAGRYQITTTLTLGKGITLRGDGPEYTQLFWPNTGKALNMINAHNGNVAIEDMEFVAGIAGMFLQAGTPAYISNNILPDASQGNVRVENVRVTQSQYLGTEAIHHREYWDSILDEYYDSGNHTMMQLYGDNNKLINCEFNWGGWMSLIGRSGKYMQVRNCTFDSTDVGTCLSVGGRYSIIEDITLQDVTMGAPGSSYVARVSINDCMWGDNRESMTSDGGASIKYQGTAEMQTDGVRFTFPERLEVGKTIEKHKIKSEEPYKLLILQGAGAGQWRNIIGYEGDTVIIESPFDAPPDGDSRFTITNAGMNSYFVDFTVDNGGMVQFYSGAINMVIDNMKITRSSGIKIYGSKPYSTCAVNWYCSVVNSDLSQGNHYHTRGWMDYWHTSEASKRLPGGSFLCAVANVGYEEPVRSLNVTFRNNRLENNCLIYLFAADSDVMLDPIIDCNHSENTRVGIYIEGSPANVLLHGNTTKNVDTPVEYYPYKHPSPYWGAVI